MGQGALSKPVVQWRLSLNSSSSVKTTEMFCVLGCESSLIETAETPRHHAYVTST